MESESSFHAHKSSPLFPINSVRLIYLSSRLHLWIPNKLIHSAFPWKLCLHFSPFHACYILCQSRPLFDDIWWILSNVRVSYGETEAAQLTSMKLDASKSSSVQKSLCRTTNRSMWKSGQRLTQRFRDRWRLCRIEPSQHKTKNMHGLLMQYRHQCRFRLVPWCNLGG
jgi:hypothetical protein